MPSNGDSEPASRGESLAEELASPYSSAAWRKLNPTSPQSRRSMIHKARPPAISRSSLASNARIGPLCNASGERKENVLQVSAWQGRPRSKLFESARTPDGAVGEQHETVADAFRVGHLVNGEQQRFAAGGHAAENGHHVPGLPEVETVEWFIHEQHWLRRQKAD